MTRIQKRRQELARSFKMLFQIFPFEHVILAPLSLLLHDDIPFHWKEEHASVFTEAEQTLTHTRELTIRITENPFFFLVDASAIGFGTVLIQAAVKDQMQVLSYSSRILTGREQKVAFMYRELIAFVFILQVYRSLTLDLKHLITIFKDNNSIFSLFARKGNKNPVCSETKVVLNDFQK